MSPPVPQINTFFQKKSKPIIEPISKIFIIASLVLGVNRLPLLSTANNYYCLLFMLIYTTLINALFFYVTVDWFLRGVPWSFLMLIDTIQYLICTTVGFLSHKRLQIFYLNLNKFDKELGINATKFGIRESVYNFLQLIVTVMISSVLFSLNGDAEFDFFQVLHLSIIKLSYCFELHYYGHLFSLIIPRLKAMHDCMKSSYPNDRIRNRLTNSPTNELQKDKKSHLDMKNLMDFYNNIIIAYDHLNDAVKWQILTLLITSFSVTLWLLYNTVKTIIWGSTETYINILVMGISMIVIQLFPLLVPCVFADCVQKEVRLIKDFLTCKLYENTLDKPSRSTARTLLALIETRNLSFSLFHMFDIDISLPFKFMALLLTYLIILLQFDKVISPNKSAKL